MKTDLIHSLTEDFESFAHKTESGIEFWLARDLQHLLGYAQWRNFNLVVSKAKTACEISGHEISDHFADVGKMVDLGSGSTREKLKQTESELSAVIDELTGGSQNFVLIRSKGDQALFGNSTQSMKLKWNVPENRPLADFAPTIILKAKDFATEITIHNARTHQMQSEGRISNEHVTNNKAVRETLLSRGIRPEALPSEEDLKKVARRLTAKEKKAQKSRDSLE